MAVDGKACVHGEPAEAEAVMQHLIGGYAGPDRQVDESQGAG